MSVYLRPHKGRTWRYDFVFRGRRYTKGGFPTRLEAESAEGARRGTLLSHQPQFAVSDLRRRAVDETDDQILSRLDDVRKLARWQNVTIDEKRIGFVYVVNAETGLTKIGKAFRPVRRFTELRTHSPAELWLLAVIPTTDAYRVEHALHAQFSKSRVRGEWFRLHCRTLAWLRGTRAAFFDNSGRLVTISHRWRDDGSPVADGVEGEDQASA